MIFGAPPSGAIVSTSCFAFPKAFSTQKIATRACTAGSIFPSISSSSLLNPFFPKSLMRVRSSSDSLGRPALFPCALFPLIKRPFASRSTKSLSPLFPVYSSVKIGDTVRYKTAWNRRCSATPVIAPAFSISSAETAPCPQPAIKTDAPAAGEEERPRRTPKSAKREDRPQFPTCPR